MPDKPEHILDLAYSCYQAQDYGQCLELLHFAENSINDNATFLLRLAVLYGYIGKHELAQSRLQAAVSLDPNNANIHFQLGETSRFLGNFDPSLSAYEKAIVLDPHHYESYLERARIKKQTLSSNHISEIEGLLNTGVRSKRGAVKLFYALTKEYEDIGDYRRAFINMGRGGSLQKESANYMPESDQHLVEQILHSFTDNVVNDNQKGYQSTEPIFIIGMPRTGTTLVERILGSHSDVFASGELYNFAGQLQRQTELHAKHTDTFIFLSPELINASLKVDLYALGQAYIESTRPLTGQTRYFTDKLPVNFFYCGLINRALPDAKIVHVHRSPMDTCLSVYKRLFADGAYPFSYNLQDIAHYYLGYRKLMNHWHQTMPGKILDVSYETLVNNFEQECQRIFEFCDLKHEASYLEFYKDKTPTATASAVQVRSPVYTSALAMWKNYEEYLKPLKDFLSSQDIEV